ncbi:MAG: hypothetical protein ACRYFS_25055 [Janthinobacterium lividum]
MEKFLYKQPPLEERNGTVRMHLKENILFVEFDAIELANFRWSLWWLATTCPDGEDITIWVRGTLIHKQEGSAISYCEITLIGEGPVGQILHNPNNDGFLQRGDRMDLFVNRAQAQEAYRSLRKLNGKKIGQQASLFGILNVRIIEAEMDTE